MASNRRIAACHATRAISHPASLLLRLYGVVAAGLVDGEMKYPFDVNNVILELAQVRCS